MPLSCCCAIVSVYLLQILIENEMEAKNLRIGNTVLDVTGFLDLEPNDFVDKPLMRRITPIQLSPDWMEGLGFEWDGERWFHKAEDWIMIDPSDNMVRLWDGWLNREIKYVHELQNLFFTLTGEELELKTVV